MGITIGQAEPGFEDPVGLMTACHRRIERFLSVLRHVAFSRNGGRLEAPETAALEKALQYFREAAPHHIEDEELGLFPALTTAAGGHKHTVASLEADHRRADVLHGVVERNGQAWLAQGYLRDSQIVELQCALDDLASLYHDHIRTEEQEVFPAARQLLGRETLDRLGRGMAARRGIAYLPAEVVTLAAAVSEKK